MPQRLPFEEFSKRARDRHGCRFGYIGSSYSKLTAKTEIVCPEHGSFWQSAQKHVQGDGCPKCSGKHRPTTEEFIAKCIWIHGDKYDYSKVTYRSCGQKVEIICPLHGPFHISPGNLLGGYGCPVCARRKNLHDDRSLQKCLTKCASTHDGKYGYRNVRYVNATTPVSITCPVHGEFRQLLHSHLDGHGCKRCAGELNREKTSGTCKEFVDKASKKHSGCYGYSQVEYINSKAKVQITCRKHGGFWQTPHDHLDGHGCPVCSHIYSKPHREIEDYLKSLRISFTSNDRTVIPPLEVDIYVPERKLGVEFNGQYWHSLGADAMPWQKRKHLDKWKLCHEAGIGLLQIDEHEWRDPLTREMWKSLLSSKLGMNAKIPARSTSFRPILPAMARDFLAKNHLQGAMCGIRWAFGLFYGEDLVAAITFCFHQNHGFLNMTRLAFRRHTTVVGGASKLFFNSLRFLPNLDIVTFSDNRYSDGNVYLTLGFENDKQLRVSYRWLFAKSIWNKRSMRHSRLKRKLPNYDPNLTEAQNLYNAGGRKLYDAGYRRWVFKVHPSNRWTDQKIAQICNPMVKAVPN